LILIFWNGEYEKDIGVPIDYCGNLKFITDKRVGVFIELESGSLRK